jgi:anti-anti-sigma factor
MHIDINTIHGGTTLKFNGTFDMDVHVAFRKAYRQALAEGENQTLLLDLSRVDYIDSSALGMLILLKSEADKQGTIVSITGCQPYVLRVLKAANFHTLFKTV